MGGLSRLCKMYGRIDMKDADGNKVIWVYDYHNDEPVLKSEMTKDQFTLSEKAKWGRFKKI